MNLRTTARESVGYSATWTITKGGVPVNITGWVFKASFRRQAGPADFTLNMAASVDPSQEGFFITDADAGKVSVRILPATLQGIADTTGKFELKGDLLATPPSMPRELVADVVIIVSEGATA